MKMLQRAPTPYHQGYLDAERAGTYRLTDGLHREPSPRFAADTHEGRCWRYGVLERVGDILEPPRRSRTYPAWRLI